MNCGRWNINLSKLPELISNWFWWYDMETLDIRQKWTDYIISLFTAFASVRDYGHAKCQADKYFLGFTGKHLSLIEALNDRYDTILRRIYITEFNNVGLVTNTWYLDPSKDTENKTWYLDSSNDIEDKIWFLNPTVTDEFNFTIFIPISLTLDQNELRQFADNYIIAGKIYDIETF